MQRDSCFSQRYQIAPDSPSKEGKRAEIMTKNVTLISFKLSFQNIHSCSKEQSGPVLKVIYFNLIQSNPTFDSPIESGPIQLLSIGMTQIMNL